MFVFPGPRTGQRPTNGSSKNWRWEPKRWNNLRTKKLEKAGPKRAKFGTKRKNISLSPSKVTSHFWWMRDKEELRMNQSLLVQFEKCTTIADVSVHRPPPPPSRIELEREKSSYQFPSDKNVLSWFERLWNERLKICVQNIRTLLLPTRTTRLIKIGYFISAQLQTSLTIRTLQGNRISQANHIDVDWIMAVILLTLVHFPMDHIKSD